MTRRPGRFRLVRCGQSRRMATTQQTFSVSAPDLFDAIVDPETYPHWLVGARRIRSVSDDWPHPDSSFRHTVGFGPLVIADDTTVRAIEAPRVLELLVRARPVLEAAVRFEVEVLPTGSRWTMVETPVGLYKTISSVAQPLIRARNERSLRRLKELLESSQSAASASAVSGPRRASAGHRALHDD